MTSHATDGDRREYAFDTGVLIFYVNGRRIEERNVDPRTTLAAYLREHRVAFIATTPYNCSSFQFI